MNYQIIRRSSNPFTTGTYVSVKPYHLSREYEKVINLAISLMSNCGSATFRSASFMYVTSTMTVGVQCSTWLCKSYQIGEFQHRDLQAI